MFWWVPDTGVVVDDTKSIQDEERVGTGGIRVNGGGAGDWVPLVHSHSTK